MLLLFHFYAPFSEQSLRGGIKMISLHKCYDTVEACLCHISKYYLSHNFCFGLRTMVYLGANFHTTEIVTDWCQKSESSMSFTHCWFLNFSWCVIPSLFQWYFRWKCNCLLGVSLKNKGLSNPSIMTLVCGHQYKKLQSDEEWGHSSTLIKRKSSIL